MKILVAYYSKTGNTKAMAELIGEGARRLGGEVSVKDVRETKAEELLRYDGIIIGSPTYYGTMAADVKRLIDESVRFHGKLDGKVGGAFSSSANIGGGNETTVMDILKAMLIHGMVVQGTPKGDHYGPVSVGKPDERSRKLCLEYGERVAKLVKKMTHTT
ncbi:MAG: NAD(P)H-dependent oxidoreductase [Candidatus Bathyarchaeia archaeon]